MSVQTKKKLSKIKCKICGKEFEHITGSHLKKHDITVCEYKEQFPDALLVSEGWCKKQREVHLDKHHTKKTKQLMRDSSPHLSGKDHPMYGVHRYGEDAPNYGNHHTDESKQKMKDNSLHLSGEKNGMFGKTGKAHPMYGRHHTEESKQLMSDNNHHLSGENAPMYGKGYLIAGEKNGMYGRSGEKSHMYGRTGKDSPMYGRTGKLSGNWKGGISFEPYCFLFNNDLKERVRNFFDRKCYVCGKNEAENGQRLSVHHVNYNKMVCCNDVKPLFVPLCRSCHAKTFKDREYWEEFFTISLEYLTDGKCFLPKNMEEKKK